MIDIFNSDAFSVISLTQGINLVPNDYGRVGASGLFTDKPQRTRIVTVEEKNGILTLINTSALDAPPEYNKMGKRKLRNFNVPYIPLMDTVLPADYSGVREFGTENALQGTVQVVNDRLATMRGKHAITLEHLRCGALKGIILDADASTIYNLFTEFGITQKTVNFALATATTKIINKCMEVKRHIEQNLMGEISNGVGCYCGSTFFDGLTTHPLVKEAFANWQAAADRLGGDNRNGFVFGGIRFEEYEGQAPDKDGTTRRFIGASDAHFFPLGTRNTFKTVLAPADFNETVNTLGKELYAKQEPRPFGKGIDIHTESNPLPMCFRPGVLVKGTVAA